MPLKCEFGIKTIDVELNEFFQWCNRPCPYYKYIINIPEQANCLVQVLTYTFIGKILRSHPPRYRLEYASAQQVPMATPCTWR